MFHVSKKHEILLYPALTVMLGALAFNVESRVVVQSILLLMGINEAMYYSLVTKTLFTDVPQEQIPAPKPEPVIAVDGYQPFVRVNGKIHLAFDTQVVKINNERRMAAILWTKHESNPDTPANLTEEYWVLQKKFFKRSEFAKDVMKRWDYNSITYRLNANRNASRDIHDWKRVEDMARGGPLPALPH